MRNVLRACELRNGTIVQTIPAAIVQSMACWMMLRVGERYYSLGTPDGNSPDNGMLGDVEEWRKALPPDRTKYIRTPRLPWDSDRPLSMSSPTGRS